MGVKNASNGTQNQNKHKNPTNTKICTHSHAETHKYLKDRTKSSHTTNYSIQDLIGAAIRPGTATHAVSYTLHNRRIKCLSCLRAPGLLTGAVTEVSRGTGERLPVYFLCLWCIVPPLLSLHTPCIKPRGNDMWIKEGRSFTGAHPDNLMLKRNVTDAAKSAVSMILFI